MLKRDLIQSSINNAIEGSPSGICCIFVPITDEIGAKCYKIKPDRDGCYNRQKAAAKVGLGPDVYGKFTIKAKNYIHHRWYEYKAGDKIYGYLTETVKVNSEWWVYDEVEELVAKLKREADFDFYDSGPNNVGFKNGKLVCIDFGYD